MFKEKDKKISVSISLGLLAGIAVFLPVCALAKTSIVFSPSMQNCLPGHDFYVQVMLNPNSERIYTADIFLSYPSQMIEVKDFTLSNGWMSPIANGYQKNSQKGEIEIVAGYPGGISQPKFVGKLLLHSKKEGGAQIKIGRNSLVLNGSNKNVFNGISNIAYFVFQEKAASSAKPVFHPVKKHTLSQTTSSPVSTSSSVVSSATSVNSSTTAFNVASRTNQTASSQKKRVSFLTAMIEVFATKQGIIVLILIIVVIIVLSVLLLVKLDKWNPLVEKIKKMVRKVRDLFSKNQPKFPQT